MYKNDSISAGYKGYQAEISGFGCPDPGLFLYSGCSPETCMKDRECTAIHYYNHNNNKFISCCKLSLVAKDSKFTSYTKGKPSLSLT